MTPEMFFLLGVFHAAVAVFTTAINLYVTHRRTVSIAAKDMSGLRAALVAEVAQLRDLYKANLVTCSIPARTRWSPAGCFR